MKFEELNYINLSHSKSIKDIKTHKKEIENKSPVLKVERENLWVKHKKATTSEQKEYIRCKIDILSDEISTLYGQRNACKRINDTYDKARYELKKEKKSKELSSNLSKTSKNEYR